MLGNIQNTKSTGPEPKRAGKKREAPPVSGKFSSILSEALEENQNVQNFTPGMENFETMFSLLEELESELIMEPSVRNYEKYKEHLQILLKDVMKKAFTVKTFRDRQKREYEVVKVVNQSMKELYSKIAGSNGDLDGVLALLGKIKGILLDIRA